MPDLGLLQPAARRLEPAITLVPERTPQPQPLAADVAEAVAVRYAPAPAMAITVQPAAEASSTDTSSPQDAGSIVSGSGRRETAAPRPIQFAPSPIRGRDLLWLALALLVIIGTGVGIRDPWPADEPRFAAIARDMVATGEWLFPRVGGDLYQDKPPLFFWLLAACYSLTGSLKWSFLLPSLAAAGGTLFLIYDLGRRLVSNTAGLAAALLTVCTLHFVMTMRGAQIDPTLCFLTSLSLYGLLRHLLLGPQWRWYVIGGFAAGLGVITKGVGFLPMLVLIPFFLMRGFGWRGLAPIDGGRAGWRWWLAPLAMLIGICLWFVPMLVAVHLSGAPEYAAYRDEILFHQTVGRYAASWHHVLPWYYFVAEVIPSLWMPWIVLAFWLVPRFRNAFRGRDARVWLPLFWMFIVLLFFSISPGKRGVYILPALPAMAICSLPFLDEVLARHGVRRAGFILAGSFFVAALVLAIAYSVGAGFAVRLIAAANLGSATALYVYAVLCGAGLVVAYARAPLAAWPVALGSLAIVFSYFIAPAMNGDRSSSSFVSAMLAQVRPEEELALVAYKEQFLLYLDRPTVNFGHRRWLEGPQESYDAAAWLNAGPLRVLLVPDDVHGTLDCFPKNAIKAGHSSDTDWYLVRGPASPVCAAQGDANRAIHYTVPMLLR